MTQTHNKIDIFVTLNQRKMHITDKGTYKL